MQKAEESVGVREGIKERYKKRERKIIIKRLGVRIWEGQHDREDKEGLRARTKGVRKKKKDKGSMRLYVKKKKKAGEKTRSKTKL